MAFLPQQEANNIQVLLADLKACTKTKNLKRGKQLQEEAVECGHDSNIYVASALINMYAKCGSMADAHQIFDSIKDPNVVSWTALILGYAENGQGLTALDLFTKMNSGGPAPNTVTYLAALKACTAKEVTSGWCYKIHDLAVENGCDSIYVQNTLIDMYGKFGRMQEARQVFDSIKHSSVVSWNALLMGYAENGQGLTALGLFKRMKTAGIQPDYVTFVAVLKSCTAVALKEQECVQWGKEIHNLAVENGCGFHTYVENTLINMYAKCSDLVNAYQVFTNMKHPNMVSWTVLILGYVENGQGLKALKLFTKMQSSGPAPDSVTFSAALKACALLGALEFGRKIHSEINSGKQLDIVLVICLVDFYAKCGSLVEAQSVFDLHPEARNKITWSTLLAGYSNSGDYESVIELFERMKDAGCQPDSITFLSILACCGHAGLVEKGREWFDTMTTNYGSIPTVEHYNCMVDIFGRANKLDEAMALLQCMYCSPNDVTWTAILDSSRKWKNLEVGRLAFQSFITLNDTDATGYLLLGQIYGSRGMLREQEMVMQMRKQLKTWKKPGESYWINEVGEVHIFFVKNA